VALCRRIERETGVRCCTSVLALNEIMEKTDHARFGLVTPCLDDVQWPSSPTERAAASTAWPNDTSCAA
jgi:maleate isomerase